MIKKMFVGPLEPARRIDFRSIFRAPQLWKAMTWLNRAKKKSSKAIAPEIIPSTTNRRKAPRRPLRQAVTVRLTSVGHYEFSGVSRDVSATGIFVIIDSDMIAVGSHVEVTLNLPSKGTQTIPLRLEGCVIRVESSAPGGIAVAFDTLVLAPAALDLKSPAQHLYQ